MADHWRRVVSIFLLLLLLDCTVQQRQFSISRAERLALIQLRSSLGIRARDWPIKSDPCSSWKGVQCSSNGGVGVRAINISGFRRTRRGNQNPQFSVDSLRNFTMLSSFNASDFFLPGPIPDWFGSQLGALQVLDLRSCSITGAIPFSIGNLTSLVRLYLSDNNLTGEIPSSFSQLIGLSVLDLSGNSLTGSIPGGIGALSRLQFLNLSANDLSSSIPPQLGNLASLVDLNLGFNSLSGAVPPDLCNLINLRRMILGDNLLSGRLVDDLFRPLTRLEFLVLRLNNFTGDLPHVLWSMDSLGFLDVSENKFTGFMRNVSLDVGPSSSMANISWNLFYGNIMPAVRSFGFVDMSGNYFEGPVPDYTRGENALLTRNCLRNTPNQRRQVECASFYADWDLVFDNFGEPNAAQPPLARSNKKDRSVIIYASVFGSVGFFMLLILVVIVVIAWRRKMGASNQRGISVGPVPAGGSPPPPGLASTLSTVGDALTYQQILQMTKEFKDGNLIKHGHSGDFFMGTLEGGLPVVVKRVDLNSSPGKKEPSYMLELDFFSRVSHPRLVPFIGHCLENENEKFLVYKCMPNGDLSNALFKKTTSDDSLKSLDWITRLKIAIGAAEGLSYLHHECSPPIVHRDVQASSILLDDKYEVRLGSLSDVCAPEGDSHQSRITRLLRLPQSSDQGFSGNNTHASCAYDVYCFGKVLLELVTGKLGISAISSSRSSADPTVKEWLDKTLPCISIYDKELVTNIIDPSLIIDEDLLEEVWSMAIVARSCLNPRPTRRPLMRYILKALENPLKVVREEHSSSSARLRTASSRGSWNAAALFGSWRHSSSDVATAPAVLSRRVERAGSFKQSATTTGSQESGQYGNGTGVSPSTRQNSKEILPEPVEEEQQGVGGD